MVQHSSGSDNENGIKPVLELRELFSNFGVAVDFAHDEIWVKNEFTKNNLPIKWDRRWIN